MPEWAGPPENYVPGVVALELVLVNTGQLAAWISAAEVYPTGAILRVVLQGRQPARQGAKAGEGTWRFGVQFADGGKATTFGLGAFARHDGLGPGRSASATSRSYGAASGADPPQGPLLQPRGGSGSRTNWHQDHWLWPLPPPGELLFACEWPNVGLGLTTTTTSADAFREAATFAQELWPAEDLPAWPGAPAG
jgi:hypothetical protein